MKARRLAPIAVILTLALGALPAAAEHRNQRRGNNGIAHVSERLAHATGALHSVATESRFRRGFHRRNALWTIERLDRDAKRFHRRVKRQGAFDRNTRVAFRHLEASFRRANQRFPVVKARRGVRRDFARVAGLMAQVEARMARIDHRIDHRRTGYRGGNDGRRHSSRSGSHAGWRLAWNFGY